MSDLQATLCPLRLERMQHTLTLSSYLHVVEDAWLLKVELDVDAALAQSLPAPAQVVVARPHPQLLGLHEVISPQDAVTQLTQASELHPACTQRH